ncbi:hypothetical protein AB4099_34920 [Bosea sp. 2KB_26]|uniref:hypothetical protein n=1 Tax=Bosea sp. 2KB_26 TaxID=3237475 RepID=UPI003F8DEBBE
MTLFNGLLCLSGEQVGCDAVKQSQGPDGRWWRSPRRIGWEAPDHDVSFSADQALGVFAYLIRTKDAQAFNRWIEWINEKRPCLITISTCIVKGWPRYCTDDQADKRCTLRPVDCAWIEAIAGYTDGKRGLCEEITSSLKLPQVPAIDIFVAGSAAVNKVGFPLHLAAVQILMLKALEREGDGAKIALQAFKLRGEPQNAFFSYVREDPMAVTSSALLSICPTKEKPSERRFQWAWERTDSEQAWKQSMYWDCVFVANLIVQR